MTPTSTQRMQELGRAIVTDASERVGLHVIRALGRAGVSVLAVEVEERARGCPGFRSRYADEKHIIAGAAQSGAQWADDLLGAGREGDVIVPCCLNSLLRVIEHHEILRGRYRTLLPPQDVLMRANDKWSLYQFARDLGVPTPHSWCPVDQKEAEHLANQVDYPVIVKFRHDQGLFLGPSARYARVEHADEFVNTWCTFHERQPRPIVQEFITGEGYGFEALYSSEGQLVASFQHRRLVECPPKGGPSAVCESVKLPALENYGSRLLDALGWTGVAMVEFRRCATTGAFRLLEINPRFWGSLPLSEAAGVNFPALYVMCAQGQHVDAPSYQEGVVVRMLPMYLRSMLIGVAQGGPDRWSTSRHLRHLIDPRVREGLIAIDDLPGSLAYIWKNLRPSRRT